RVGDATRCDARRAADPNRAIERVEIVEQSIAVVLIHHADVDPGRAAQQRVWDDAAALERLPGQLEQQAMLRIHHLGLARADAEELRIKCGRVVDEAAGAGDRLAWNRWIGIEEIERPAAVAWELGDRVAALGKKAPERLRAIDAAGVAAGER